MKRTILNIKDKEKVASMYESGMSQKQIAKVFGVSAGYISIFIKKYNIKDSSIAEQQMVIKNGK